MIRCLPNTAERDIQIIRLGWTNRNLLRDSQPVSDIIQDNLIKYDITFYEESGVADFPINLRLWRNRGDQTDSVNVKTVITKYWAERKLVFTRKLPGNYLKHFRYFLAKFERLTPNMERRGQ